MRRSKVFCSAKSVQLQYFRKLYIYHGKHVAESSEKTSHMNSSKEQYTERWKNVVSQFQPWTYIQQKNLYFSRMIQDLQ